MGVEFGVLGPFEARRGGAVLNVSSPKQRLLIALLLTRPNEVLSVDGLVEGLWNGSPPDSAVGLVQTYVSQLRKVLEDPGLGATRSQVLVRAGPGYRVVVNRTELDAYCFEELVDAGRTALHNQRPHPALELLDEALSLWRGPPFGEFEHEPSVQPAAQRLAELQRLAFEHRADAAIALGRHAELIGELEARVLDDPLRERTWAQLMLCLYRSGRQADALGAYQRLRRHLGEELGLEPGAAVRRLENEILRQLPSLDWAPSTTSTDASSGQRPGGAQSAGQAHDDFVAADASRHTWRGRVPSRLSRFVGREREQADVAEVLATTRLLTLVGPGGIGKTRLALRVAAELAERLRHGVWFIELAPVGAGAVVDHAVASALGFQAQPQLAARDQLLDGLSDWNAILLLDNCEHLRESVAELVEALLDRCSGVTVLATSRAPLHVAGERVWQVGPLDLDIDAPALFADRAASARPGFALDADTKPVVRAICQQLDCMPLALELAAARLRSMTAPELLEHLGRRFRLLRADRAGHPSRHATLTAVVEWSYGLLTPSAQHLLRQLAVFAGGFELAAAHVVSSSGDGQSDQLDTLDVLDTLVDHSLVQVDEHKGRTRYSMLETLRQYALAQLSATEIEEIRARHAAYYLAFARDADLRLRGAEQAAWLDRLELEHDNFRGALTWAFGARGDATTGLRITAALWWFWRTRSHVAEGRRWYGLALSTLPTAETSSDRVRALTGAGLLDYFSRSYDAAKSEFAEARDEAIAAGDDVGAAWALHGLGRVAHDTRDYTSASAHFAESIERFEMCDDTRGAAYSRLFFSSVAGYGGDAAMAEQLIVSADATFRAIGDVWGLVGVAVVRAWQADAARNWVDAARHYGEQLARSAEIDSRWLMSHALFGLAHSAAQLRSWPLAVELYGSARAVCSAMGAQADKLGGTAERRCMEAAREALGAEAVDRLWKQAHGRHLDEAVATGVRAAEQLTANAAPAAHV